MEEAKSTVTTNTIHLKTTVPPPTPQPDPLAKSHSPSNKRKLIDVADLHQSPYYKIRAIARQLRPLFIQVLQTPDFRNCKAAHEIKEHVKLMVDLYRQTIAETDKLKTFVAEPRPSAGQNVLGKCSSGEHQEGKQSELLQSKQSLEKSAEKKPQTPHFNSEKLDDIGKSRESYIVGGSVFGWNFITFSSSKPVYYGVTRESFRRSRKKLGRYSVHNK